MRERGTGRLAGAILLAAAAGCAAPGRNYHDGNMDFGSLKTVVVLPFANLSGNAAAAERMRDAFSAGLLATGALYVVPTGEVNRGLVRLSIGQTSAPSAEEVVKLGQLLKADAVVAGVVREYGEVRSGSAAGTVASLSVQLQETATGKVVFQAVSTKGGLSFWSRLVGSGGSPMNEVTEAVVDDAIAKLFK